MKSPTGTQAEGLAEGLGDAERPGAVFGSLIGQAPLVDELSRAVTAAWSGRRRPAHAWLFTGPPGSGRSVAARAFAAALLCEHSGCGQCRTCRQVLAGTHADLLLIRPEGLSYGVRQTRELVLRAATTPVSGRWRIVIFEDADRATEQAANALLKAIEEPAPATIWLLCAPYADDLPVTVRSRCRLVTLRTPPTEAVAAVLEHDGIPAERARWAAAAAQGHVGRARRLATDTEAANRRAEVLRQPARLTGVGTALAAAAELVGSAAAEADAITGQLNGPEREELRRAYGEGSSGKGVVAALRGAVGPLRELEERQKSRATRLKRDALDRALLDLAGFYRDVLAIQFGADVELANAGQRAELERLAARDVPATTVGNIEAIMKCRERLAASVAPQLAVEEMMLALAADAIAKR